MAIHIQVSRILFLHVSLLFCLQIQTISASPNADLSLQLSEIIMPCPFFDLESGEAESHGGHIVHFNHFPSLRGSVQSLGRV